MWDYIRRFFKKETPPVNEEVVQTNIEEKTIEIGPKEGMPETYWRDQAGEVSAPNEQPGIAEGRDLGLGRMENANTTTNEKAAQSIEEKIQSIIDERGRVEDISGQIGNEASTQKWAEKHPSRHGTNTIKSPQEPNTIETPEAAESAIDSPEVNEGAPGGEGESSTGFGTGGGGRGGGYGGGGGTPDKDMDILEGKDDMIDNGDDPLSRNDEGVQNPAENLAGNGIAQEGNSTDRLAALFRGDTKVTEKDAMPDVQDKTEDLQPGQNENADLGKADRLAALFRGDNQEPEKDAMPDVQDRTEDLQPGQDDNAATGNADRLAALFRGDNQEPEKDAMPDVQDKTEDLQPGQNENADLGKADRLAALFRGNNQEPEKDAMPDVQDRTEDLQPGQDDNAATGNADRLAALFRGDNQELENNELPEISDERKEAIYLAFNEGRADSEVEDYFPVDKSVTEDFANDRGNDEDMDVDVPDIGDAGGDD